MHHQAIFISHHRHTDCDYTVCKIQCEAAALRVEHKVPQLFTVVEKRFQVFCLGERKKETLHPFVSSALTCTCSLCTETESIDVHHRRPKYGTLEVPQTVRPADWWTDVKRLVSIGRKGRKWRKEDEEIKTQYSGWRFWLFLSSKTATVRDHFNQQKTKGHFIDHRDVL